MDGYAGKIVGIESKRFPSFKLHLLLLEVSPEDGPNLPELVGQALERRGRQFCRESTCRGGGHRCRGHTRGHPTGKVLGEWRTAGVELRGTRLDTQVIVIQGMKDRLVSPRNSAYVEKTWKQSFSSLRTIEIEDAGHFLPWNFAPLVRESIREFKF